MDYRGILRSRVGMTVPLRIILVIAEAALLLALVAVVAVYFMRGCDDDRRRLHNHVRQAQILSGGLDSLALSGAEPVRAALDFHLAVLKQVLAAQESRAASVYRILLAAAGGGLLIITVMGYAVIRNILKKYPELREER